MPAYAMKPSEITARRVCGTPLGDLVLSASTAGLCEAEFVDSEEMLSVQIPHFSPEVLSLIHI